MMRVIVFIIIVFSFIMVSTTHAALIDWDRKLGLRALEGIVVSIDRRENQITVSSRTNGDNTTFRATAELLQGISENDPVRLKYKRDTDLLHSIKKMK